MSDTTTNLMFPFLASGQAQKHVTVNESLRRLDALVQLSVISATTGAQPGSPSDGQVYILPTGKSGADWGAMSTHALAYYRDGAWEEITPREGFSAYVADADKVLTFNGAAWAETASAAFVAQRDAGQLQGFKNRLINGGFRFNQRAPASNADDTYGFDRWNVLTQSGAVACSQLTDPETGAPFGLRLTQSQASAQRMGIAQIVESANCRDLRSAVTTLAGRVRRSDGGDVRYAVLEWTGTADSVTSDVVNDWTSSTYTAGNFFIASNVNVLAAGVVTTAAATWAALGALSATFGSSMNNAIVMCWAANTMAQNATLDFNRLQFEPGAAATVFETLPAQIELALCQRYYEKSFAIGAAPVQGGGVQNGAFFFIAPAAGAVLNRSQSQSFRVVKRTTPTMTLYNPINANAQVYDGNVTGDCSGTTSPSVSEASFCVNATGNASTAIGDRLGVHWTADAEL